MLGKPNKLTQVVHFDALRLRCIHLLPFASSRSLYDLDESLALEIECHTRDIRLALLEFLSW